MERGLEEWGETEATRCLASEMKTWSIHLTPSMPIGTSVFWFFSEIDTQMCMHTHMHAHVSQDWQQLGSFLFWRCHWITWFISYFLGRGAHFWLWLSSLFFPYLRCQLSDEEQKWQGQNTKFSIGKGKQGESCFCCQPQYCSFWLEQTPHPLWLI